jgi:hypothetical protein
MAEISFSKPHSVLELRRLAAACVIAAALLPLQALAASDYDVISVGADPTQDDGAITVTEDDDSINIHMGGDPNHGVYHNPSQQNEYVYPPEGWHGGHHGWDCGQRGGEGCQGQYQGGQGYRGAQDGMRGRQDYRVMPQQRQNGPDDYRSVRCTDGSDCVEY